jgi:hypothetical protein
VQLGIGRAGATRMYEKDTAVEVAADVRDRLLRLRQGTGRTS